MAQKTLKKKPSEAKPLVKRSNKPKASKEGFKNPALAKLRKGKKVVGASLIEGKLANVVIGNNENIKYVTPKEQHHRVKKTHI